MKVEDSITILSGAARESRRLEHEYGGKSGKTVFAGNLQGDYTLQDRIRQRKEQAQRRALKVVSDAWDGDRKMEEEAHRSREHASVLKQENAQYRLEINEYKKQQEELKARYQVEDGSQEQQDVELLKKACAAGHKGVSGVELTEAERGHLARLQEKELTEYQSRILEMEDHIWTNQEEIWLNNKGSVWYQKTGIEKEYSVVRGIREERRKVHPMLDAKERAEDIKDASLREVINMAVGEAKEYLDQEQEKRDEEAGDIKEQKEKLEEVLKRREEREDALEELVEELSVDKVADAGQTMSEVRRQIQAIVNEMNLVVEDIKGSQVDTNI